jgi:hypothetical protein
MKLAPGSGFVIRIQHALKLKQSRPSAATGLANSTLRPINFESESRIPNPGLTSGRQFWPNLLLTNNYRCTVHCIQTMPPLCWDHDHRSPCDQIDHSLGQAVIDIRANWSTIVCFWKGHRNYGLNLVNCLSGQYSTIIDIFFEWAQCEITYSALLFGLKSIYPFVHISRNRLY